MEVGNGRLLSTKSARKLARRTWNRQLLKVRRLSFISFGHSVFYTCIWEELWLLHVFVTNLRDVTLVNGRISSQNNKKNLKFSQVMYTFLGFSMWGVVPKKDNLLCLRDSFQSGRLYLRLRGCVSVGNYLQTQSVDLQTIKIQGTWGLVLSWSLLLNSSWHPSSIGETRNFNSPSWSFRNVKEGRDWVLRH